MATIGVPETTRIAQVNNKMATLTVSDEVLDQSIPDPSLCVNKLGSDEVRGDVMKEDVLDRFAKLHKTHHYISTMQEIEKISAMLSNQGVLIDQEGPDTKLLADCFALRVAIVRDIYRLKRVIIEMYKSRFPTLHVHLHDPVNYARAVKKIGNEMDAARVDLEGFLSPLVISFFPWEDIASPPLPQEILQTTFDACDRLLALHSDYEKIGPFVDSLTEYFAPNLCAVFGSQGAAKLIAGTAGGLPALANIPAADFVLVGSKKVMDLQRFLAEMPQFSYLEQTKFLTDIPERLRFLAYRYVARNSVVAARVDWKREDPTGNTGRCIRDKIIVVAEQWRKNDPLPIFKPKEGKIDGVSDSKVYGVKDAAMGMLGEKAKKLRKKKKDEGLEGKVKKPRKKYEGLEEMLAKLEAVKKMEKPFCDLNLFGLLAIN